MTLVIEYGLWIPWKICDVDYTPEVGNNWGTMPPLTLVGLPAKQLVFDRAGGGFGFPSQQEEAVVIWKETVVFLSLISSTASFTSNSWDL